MMQLLQELSFLEIVGLLSGIGYVVLAARAHVWCWPIGLINVAVFLFINYEAKLYADTALQVVYLILTLYGWYKWVEKPDNSTEALYISTTTSKQWIYLSGIVVIGAIVMSVLLDRYTDTDVPRWDAIVTSLSLVATWMVAQKKLENWLVWIVTDVLYVGLYYYKGYMLLTILFVIYIVVAVQGYFYWRKLQATQKPI
jgi:nicotinamide mononucleotide transporter